MKTGNQSRRRISIGSFKKSKNHAAKTLKNNNYEYNLITKGYFKSDAECCVVCGRKDELTMNHIVPFHFRVYFPIITNGILRKADEHDVLPLCKKCSIAYGREIRKFSDQLCLLNGLVHNNKLQNSFDKIRSFLINSKKGLPSPNTTPERQKEYKEKMINSIDHFFIGGIDEKDHKLFGGKTPLMGQHRSYLCMLKYRHLHDIQKFVEFCRGHFLKFMEPRYLPTGWSVKRSVLAEMAVPAKKV